MEREKNIRMHGVGEKSPFFAIFLQLIWPNSLTPGHVLMWLTSLFLANRRFHRHILLKFKTRRHASHFLKKQKESATLGWNNLRKWYVIFIPT
jgi:hypothetical protein